MVIVLVTFIKSRGAKEGKNRERIFTSNDENQSVVEGAHRPEIGRSPVRKSYSAPENLPGAQLKRPL